MIAHEVAHYLIATGQLPGPNSEVACDSFADEMLEKHIATLTGKEAELVGE